jgi:hypothetical protein
MKDTTTSSILANGEVSQSSQVNSVQQAFSIDPSVLQLASYGGALGALLLLLFIIRSTTKLVQEVKKDN